MIIALNASTDRSKSLARKFNNKPEISIEQLYQLNPGDLWRALKAEHISLWMLCFYFFFEYVRLQTQYRSLEILPWAQIFLILTVLMAFMDKSVVWVKNTMNVYMVVLTIIIVLSGVFAFYPKASLEGWKVFGGWFLIYFSMVNIVNTEKRLLLFFLAYCLFNLKMAQHGAIAWTARGFSFTGYGLVGAPGWFRNSGEFAIQMLIYGPLALSIVIALKDYWGKYKKILLFACAIAGFMSVMGASSRGAQIALLAIGCWWLIQMRLGLKALLLASLVGVIAFMLLPEAQLNRFSEMGEDNNSLQRLAYWKYAIDEVIPRFPVLGVGYFNWIPYVSFMVPDGMGPYQTVEVSHNIFIEAASELGLVGLVCYVSMIIYAFIMNRRTRKMANELDNKLHYMMAYGLDAGMVGYLVAGQFVTVFYYPFSWIQFAMIATLYSVTRGSYLSRYPDAGRRGRARANQHLV